MSKNKLMTPIACACPVGNEGKGSMKLNWLMAPAVSRKVTKQILGSSTINVANKLRSNNFVVRTKRSQQD